MKHLLSSLLVLASTSFVSLGQAQEAKVIKVKGQQAIVQFPNGVLPVVGEMIPVAGDAPNEAGAHSRRANRAHLLALIGTISFTNNNQTSNSTTTFDVQGRYGWNEEIFEFGPLARVYYSSTTGQSDRKLVGGGFFDFNFVPNKAGIPIVYGVGLTGDFGQDSFTLGNSTSTTTSIYDLFAGGNVKWFGLSDNVALRADAGFSISQSNSLGTSATVNTGLLILGGISFYF